ncbi:MAG: extracellular solute-binding protein [Pseudomonadota bacterium]
MRARSRAKAQTRSPLKWLGASALIVAGAFWAFDAAAEETIVSHGYSYYGDLKYPADYPHFDYVNPDAPKGGEIALSVVGTFDSMHPYTRKGRAAALSSVMYESLLGQGTNAAAPADIYGEYYCLLCERLEYDAGKTYAIFYMRPEARFSDGTPVTAHDIAFSHNLLLDEGLKSYADAVRKRIPKVEVIDDHTIKFYFTEGITRRSLIDQVGFVPAWSKTWYEETGAGLDESRLEVSPGSGPYMIAEVDVNRRVVYERNPDYWGNDLPFNVGRNNFDRIRIEYFGDDNAAFEGFKAGEYTFRSENDSRKWAQQYDFPKVQQGQVVQVSLPDGAPPANSGIVFNLLRPNLQDPRVRAALSLAYNFEWTNASLQFGLFSQRESFSQGTDLQATGLPTGAELEVLQSLEGKVDPKVLTEAVPLPHTSREERLVDRRNLRAAMRLLDEAGWAVGDDGMRRNAAGETLAINFLFNSASSPTSNAVMENYVSNVKAMGVDITFERVDPSQYTNRERDKDYDLVFDSYPALIAAGTGLQQRFGSEAAEFSLFNPAALASEAVDAVIDAALNAETREEEQAAMTALDRILRHERMMIPVWYNPDHWVAMYDMYEYPEEIAPWALGFLDYWWFDADKAEALRAAGALR